MAHEDPRTNPAPLAAVPKLLAEGHDHYAARRFWHGHEAWESAWHALRAADDADGAAFVRGMILITAAFENATRDKSVGFRRQMAEGLHALRAHTGAGERIGLHDAQAWVEALTAFFIDAVRHHDLNAWLARPWTAPPLRLRERP